jgi:tetratricopeptide (TPR) repeat protein
LEAVARLDPDSPTALRTRGQFCYAVDRNFACAEENYARVATLLPNDPEIAFKLGWTRWNLSRWSEAVDALRKAVRLDPDVAHMTRDLADWLEQGRRYRDAQPVRQRLARLQPVDEPRHSFRAAMCFFLATGSPVEVEAFFAGLTEAQANSAAGIGVRRQWAIATGNRTEFLRLERTPGGGGVNKALMLLAHGDAPAAREVLEGRSAALKSSAEQTPNRHGILAELAEVEALLGRREEALAWVGKLRELRPWNVPAAGPVRAFVHAWTGDKERAIAEYARLLQTVGGPNVHVMRRDPRYAPLQGDPRFEALLNDPKNSAPLF